MKKQIRDKFDFLKEDFKLSILRKLDYNTPTCHFSNFVFVLCVKSIFEFIGNLEASRCDLIDANSRKPSFYLLLCFDFAWEWLYHSPHVLYSFIQYSPLSWVQSYSDASTWKKWKIAFQIGKKNQDFFW